ncbi:MAG: hypothetical protein GX455_06675 [Phycisphaerae bacterium]|nr:hypothetical protein [Phycisphaerae bacterium]
MEKQIKSIAIRFAALIFFVMGVTGALCGQSPATIGFRAFLGSIAAYIVSSIAARLVTHILINEALRNKLDKTFSDLPKPKETD